MTAALSALVEYIRKFEGDNWIDPAALLPGKEVALPTGIRLEMSDQPGGRTRAMLHWGERSRRVPLTSEPALGTTATGNPPLYTISALDLVRELGHIVGIPSPDDEPENGMGRKRQMRCWQQAFEECCAFGIEGHLEAKARRIEARAIWIAERDAQTKAASP